MIEREKCQVYNAIEINGLSFSYQKTLVLKNINLNIESGDFVCILGESGCGKSTLLQILAGLIDPTVGEILINQSPINGAGLDRGVVFQDYSLYPWLTTGKNMMLSLGQKYKTLSKQKLIRMTLQWFKEVNLDSKVFHKYPFQLSGGMRQRCAVCRAFALDPPILLMDEPFGALDAVTRAKLQQLTLKLWKKDNEDPKTIIFVTHDIDEAIFLANKIYLLGANPGRIIHEHIFHDKKISSMTELFEQPEVIELRNKFLQLLTKDAHQQSPTF